MNDCIWYGIEICDCKSGSCDKYLSINGEEGSEIAHRYEKDVQEALAPVRVKYKEKYL